MNVAHEKMGWLASGALADTLGDWISALVVASIASEFRKSGERKAAFVLWFLGATLLFPILRHLRHFR
jgi:thiamine transporter ThiT